MEENQHEASQMEELFRLIRRLGEPDTDEALIAYLVSETFQTGRTPPKWLVRFRREVERQLVENPELRQRLEGLRARQRMLEEALPPPEIHLKHLQTEISEAPVEIRSPGRVTYLRGWRIALAALFVLLTTYGLLFAYFYLHMPPPQRWVWRIEVPEIRPETLVFRGESAMRSSATSDFLVGLRYLRQAKKFGKLLPYLDVSALEEAACYFLRARQHADEGSYLYFEATYYLALTYLAEGRVEEARPLLAEVAASRGRHAAEARRLLQQLQA